MEDPKCFSNAQADVELCRGRRGKGSGTSSSNQTAVIVPHTSISQCYDYTKTDYSTHLSSETGWLFLLACALCKTIDMDVPFHAML